jgi:hypothetical protein
VTAAAVLLSLERMAYDGICRRPEWLWRVCGAVPGTACSLFAMRL